MHSELHYYNVRVKLQGLHVINAVEKIPLSIGFNHGRSMVLNEHVIMKLGWITILTQTKPIPKTQEHMPKHMIGPNWTPQFAAGNRQSSPSAFRSLDKPLPSPSRLSGSTPQFAAGKPTVVPFGNKQVESVATPDTRLKHWTLAKLKLIEHKARLL
ncbi:hypothetical protein L1049_005049 [Liquidambar formosana]|uniref:Uncharacterized protein n=1 Tax=Liquidambar formosana TaxID=63359 RepID=A0AAP0RTN6_LIQFO